MPRSAAHWTGATNEIQNEMKSDTAATVKAMANRFHEGRVAEPRA